MSSARVLNADCLAALRDMPDASVDAIVTDPPYGLSNTTPAQVTDTITRWVTGDREYLPTGRGFMGHEWDGFVPPVAVWDECLRVLKPGGHLLAFAGSRTHDLMTLGIRLAGFEIRDSVAWLYGSGMPKSLDVSKAIDKAGGDPLAFRRFAHAYAEAISSSSYRHSEIDRHLGVKSSSCYWARADHRGGLPPRHHWDKVRDLLGLPAELEALYDEAEREVIGVKKGAMSGWSMDGTTQFVDRDVTAPATDAAREWEGWGTALKPAFEPVTLARKPLTGNVAANVLEHGTGALNIDACRIGGDGGRWPANVVLDEDQAAELDRQSGNVKTGATKPHLRDPDSDPMFKVGKWMTHSQPASEGGASRFFYIARKDNECPSGQSSSTVSTAEMSSSGEGQPPASALNGAATSERHDTGRQTGSPSTSETQNGSKPNATTDTPTTPTIESASSPERQHASTTLTRNPANSAEPNPQTDTMTTTTSHLKSAGSAESATSSTTQKSKELGDMGLGDSSRFMYCAKAPKSERPVVDGVAHSTVKPVTLMKWLVRMVTPPGGTVLDPFAGSGTTLEAAMLEGFNAVGIEREADYLPLIHARIERATTALEGETND